MNINHYIKTLQFVHLLIANIQPNSTHPPSNIMSPSNIMFTCNQCPEEFNTEGARKTHVRKNHQMQTEVTTTTGSVVVVHKMDGVFACPVAGCNASYPNPAHLHTHIKNCNPSKFISRPEPHRGNAKLVPLGSQITCVFLFL